MAGDLHLDYAVLQQASAALRTQSEDAAAIVAASIDHSGNASVSDAVAHVELWYRGVAAVFSARLAQFGLDADAVAEAFAAADTDIAAGTDS